MADPYPLPVSAARVLTNPDLLHAIFTFLPSTQDGRDSYLARCATVCRAFQEPAARILWRTLDALLPLWHILAPLNIPFPSRYYYYNSDGELHDHGEVLTYLQKVNSAQLYLDPILWDRFRWHTTHVRRMGRLLYDTEAIDDANRLLVRAVVMQNGGITVLPLLHTLHWRPRASAPLAFGESPPIQLFTSTLRHATLDFIGTDEAEIVPLLRRLRETSPLLEKIAIVTRQSQLDTSPSIIILELLCFTKLSQVQVSQIGLGAFQALATGLPNLTHLQVFNVIGPPGVGSSRTISTISNVHELVVKGDPSTLFGVFNLVHFRSLKRAKVCLDSSIEMLVTLPDITATLAQFYTAVSESTGLQEFELMVCSPARRVHGTEPSLRNLIAPLLPIRHLRLFSLTAAGSVAKLDTADVEALASAWPHIERLLIDDGIIPDSPLSIRAIHHLHKHCPRLEEVHVPGLRLPIIGVHEIPAPLPPVVDPRAPSSESPESGHPLRHLSVRPRWVIQTSRSLLALHLSDEGAEAMARYLLALFPSLDPQRYARELDDLIPERRTPTPALTHFDDRWPKIVGHICAIRRARDGL